MYQELHVGHPNFRIKYGRSNATYVIYDNDTDQITLREVEYDYQKTCAAIIENGLPIRQSPRPNALLLPGKNREHDDLAGDRRHAVPACEN
jgi:hypothetical protein